MQMVSSCDHRSETLQLTSLRELGSWIKRRLGDWQLECRQALKLLSQAGNTGRWSSTADVHNGSVEFMWDNVLEKTPSFDKNPLTNLLERTFESGYLHDYYQKSLIWVCYWSALPVRERLLKHGSAFPSTCLRLSCTPSYSVWKLGYWPPISSSCYQPEKEYSYQLNLLWILCLPYSWTGKRVVSVRKETLWRTCMKGIATIPSFSGRRLELFSYFNHQLKCKIWLERRYLLRRMFDKKWTSVVGKLLMNGNG